MIKKSIHHFISFFILVIFSTKSLAFDFCDLDISDVKEAIDIVLGDIKVVTGKHMGRDPIPYVPFTTNDLQAIAESVSDDTGALFVISGNQVIFKELNDENQAEEVYRNSLQNTVKMLNDMEKIITPHGYTLRSTDSNDSVVDEIWALFTIDPKKAQEQMKENLGVWTKGKQQELQECFETILADDCPQLDLSSVTDAFSGVSNSSLIALSDGTTLSVESLVNSANESAKKGCALGEKLFEGSHFEISGARATWVGGDQITNLIYAIENKIEVINVKFDTEHEASPFNLSNFINFKAIDELTEKFNDIADNLKNDTLESLHKIKADLGLDNIDFEMPNISYGKTIDEPEPPPLDLKKRKDWVGWKIGNKKIIASEAYAYYELRAKEIDMSAQAYGTVGGHIFKNDFNLVSVAGDFYAGKSNAKASIEAQYFGNDWDWKEEEEYGLAYTEVDHPLWSVDKGWDWWFTIGPIPIHVQLGIYADLGFQYAYGVNFQNLYGKAGPYVEAGGWALGEVSVVVVSAGARANIVVVDITAPLVGEAALRFAPDNKPYLKVDIHANLEAEVLKGIIYAFVKYYVPRFGLPPWKKKTSKYTLHKWGGKQYKHRIIHWGMTYGYDRVEMRGDLIDQHDLRHAEELDAAILLQKKKEVVVDYYNETTGRLNTVFTNMTNDLNANNNTQSMTRIISNGADRLEDDMVSYLDKLSVMAYQLDEVSELVYSDATLSNCIESNYVDTKVNQLYELTCSGLGINSLLGMEQLSSLQNIDLSFNDIVDLTPLLSLDVNLVESIDLTGNNNAQCHQLDALKNKFPNKVILPESCFDISILIPILFLMG